MHILLTRPLEDCSEMILRLQSLGNKVSHLPLLNINKVNYEKISLSDFKGIIFTSANAVKFLKLDMARPDFVGWTSLKMNSIKFWKLDRARPDFVGLKTFLNLLHQNLKSR